MIERCLLILLAVALVGSLGGFFLYVPILPTLVVTVMVGGLCAMFWLGMCVGRQPRNLSFFHTPADTPSAPRNQLSLL